jgi:hypothetical protein
MNQRPLDGITVATTTDQIEPAGATRNAAEGEGFEPSVRRSRTTVFETAPFNHSGTPPGPVSGTAKGSCYPSRERSSTRRRSSESEGLTGKTRCGRHSSMKSLRAGEANEYWIWKRGFAGRRLPK